ncbi:hypothetical protein PCK1_002096, partial [Pneumocystis canis]
TMSRYWALLVKDVVDLNLIKVRSRGDPHQLMITDEEYLITIEIAES